MAFGIALPRNLAWSWRADADVLSIIGNFYSIENKGTKNARIFFAQGYEHVAGEDVEGH